MSMVERRAKRSFTKQQGETMSECPFCGGVSREEWSEQHNFYVYLCARCGISFY